MYDRLAQPVEATSESLSASNVSNGCPGPSARRFLLQSLLACVAIIGIMLVLDLILHTAIVTSLGATTFIAFAMPSAPSAQPRRLVGGYVVGGLAGLLCCYAAGWLPRLSPAVDAHTVQIVLAGIAVGLASWLMVTLRVEHPPAAGFALGLVLDTWTLSTLAFVTGAVLLISALRLGLRSLLADLA